MRFVLVCAFMVTLTNLAAAASINLLESNPNTPNFNNPSFEVPDTAFVSLAAPPWELTGPRHLVNVPPFGIIPIVEGCGIFENLPPMTAGHLAGLNGAQAGYIFANSSADAITSVPMDHAFTQRLGATIAQDWTYTLTIGFANAQAAPPPDSVLTMSLFAYDPMNTNSEQLLVSQPVLASDLNGTSITDIPIVTPPVTGIAVGWNIGIRLSTHTVTKPASATGQFDFDNVRLTAIPEPASAGLLGVAALAMCLRRQRI